MLTGGNHTIESSLEAALRIDDPTRRLVELLTIITAHNPGASAFVAAVLSHNGGAPQDLQVLAATGAEGRPVARRGTLLPLSSFADRVLRGGPGGWTEFGTPEGPETNHDIAIEAGCGSFGAALGRPIFRRDGSPAALILLVHGTGGQGALNVAELESVAVEIGTIAAAHAPTEAESAGGKTLDGQLGESPSSVGRRLRDIEERYRRFIAHTSEAIWCLDLDTPIHHRASPAESVEAVLTSSRFAEANTTFIERFDRGVDSVLEGRPPTDVSGFWLTQDIERLENLAKHRFSATDLSVSEVDSLGRVRYLSCSLFGLVDARGLSSIWGLERDVTANVEENQELRESEELYKAITRTALDGICVLDADLSVLDCNDAFAELVGQSRDDVIFDARCRLAPGDPTSKGRPQARGNHPTFDEIVDARSWRGDATLWRADETTIPIELACRFVEMGRGRFYCFVRDLSESRQAARREREHQEALSEVSRLSTLGEMASGIAHEFNQPLAAIVNYANGCVRSLEQDGYGGEAVFDALRAIAQQVERAAEIIQRLRSFSRRAEEHREPFILSELLVDAIDLATKSTHRAGIRIDSEFVAGDDVVLVDGIQIEQAMLNLLLNAAASIRRAGLVEGQGVIRVTSRVSSAKQGAGDRGIVEVAVHDNGAGVHEDAVKRLFEPFYSHSGDGLGLGLTIGRSIIEAHGGRLWLDLANRAAVADSGPDAAATQAKGGACFRFTLPVRPG